MKNNFINNNKFKPNINFSDSKKPSSNNNNNKNKNTDVSKIKSSCKDEIGKKCLELTNIFRAKHNLPPLVWNDDMWKIFIYP